MELKPGYKKTDIGVIPDDWDVLPLGEILVSAELGGNYPNTETQSNFPLMKMGNVGRGKFNTSRFEFVHQIIVPSDRHRLRPGDVIFNTRNTLDLVGKIAIWRNELDAAFYNSNLMRLVFDPTIILSNEYANLALNTEATVSRLRALATGTTSVAAIYTRDLLKLPVVVPPRPEQKAIAESLSDVDASIAALSRLIAKKRDLRQGAMQRLLTGQTRLPGFNDPWQEKRLGDAGKCLRGVSYRGDSDLAIHDTPHTRRLLRSNNVQNATVVTSEVQFVNAARVVSRQILKRDDILICMANGSKALVGKAGSFVVNDGNEYTFGTFMGCFRTNSSEADPVFVFYLFLTVQYRNYISNLLAGSSINNLRPSSIESLVFSTPPLPEQTAIAAVLSDMDAELAALEARRDKTGALKQAMMQALLNGRVRLPVRLDAAPQTKEAAHA